MTKATHGAPAVVYPLSFPRRGMLACAGMAAAGLLLLCGWTLAEGAADARQAAMLALWLACAAVLYRFTRAQKRRIASGRQLEWSARVWRWEDAQAYCEATALRVHLDGQRWILASARCGGSGRRWFWLEQRSNPQKWHALRCAVFSHEPRADEVTGMTGTNA